VFRATMTVAFLALSVAGLAVLLAARDPHLSAGLIVAALAGTLVGWGVGANVFRRMHPSHHRRAVTGLLVATALASIVAGLS
jgi:uncharacterized membrane protein YfcA